MTQAVEDTPPSNRNVPVLSSWYWRVPLKVLVFCVVLLFVLFPNPARLVRHLSHVSDMEGMIDSDAPELAELEREVRAKIAAQSRPAEGEGLSSPSSDWLVQLAVQQVVYARVLYEWDWNLWGCADYMPTIGEVFAKAAESDGKLREDCDGRAIIAAALMRRLGYEPLLATDLRHVWVETKEGEWMGPGRVKTLQSSTEGNKFRATLSNVPIALSYGVAVFPLGRELIILMTIVILAYHRRMSHRALALGVLLLIDGLLFMRTGYLSPGEVSLEASAWPAWVGVLHCCIGLPILWVSAHRARRREPSASNGALPSR